MPLSAWITLIIVGGILFGGVAWSIIIALKKNNEQSE